METVDTGIEGDAVVVVWDGTEAGLGIGAWGGDVLLSSSSLSSNEISTVIKYGWARGKETWEVCRIHNMYAVLYAGWWHRRFGLEAHAATWRIERRQGLIGRRSGILTGVTGGEAEGQ